MLLSIFPILVLILGLVTYFVAANVKVAELGRLAAFAGLLALCFEYASHIVRVGS